jgi:hypothetical protein
MSMTWQAFRDKVLESLPVNNDREGIQDLLENLLRDCVIEMQNLCQQLRSGNATLIDETQVFTDNLANYGDLPDDAHISEAWILTPCEPTGDEETLEDFGPCERHKLEPAPWGNRFDLICNKNAQWNYRYAIDHYGRRFYSRPVLDENMRVLLIWDGLKRSFANLDVVPYPVEMAGIVAIYVEAQLARRIDKDRDLYADLMREFGRRRRLFIVERKETATINRS